MSGSSAFLLCLLTFTYVRTTCLTRLYLTAFYPSRRWSAADSAINTMEGNQNKPPPYLALVPTLLE